MTESSTRIVSDHNTQSVLCGAGATATRPLVACRGTIDPPPDQRVGTYLAVISYELDAMAWVHGRGAEVTPLDPHGARSATGAELRRIGRRPRATTWRSRYNDVSVDY